MNAAQPATETVRVGTRERMVQPACLAGDGTRFPPLSPQTWQLHDWPRGSNQLNGLYISKISGTVDHQTVYRTTEYQPVLGEGPRGPYGKGREEPLSVERFCLAAATLLAAVSCICCWCDRYTPVMPAPPLLTTSLLPRILVNVPSDPASRTASLAYKHTQ